MATFSSHCPSADKSKLSPEEITIFNEIGKDLIPCFEHAHQNRFEISLYCFSLLLTIILSFAEEHIRQTNTYTLSLKWHLFTYDAFLFGGRAYIVFDVSGDRTEQLDHPRI